MGRDYDPIALVVTVTLGLAGALGAVRLGTPLPWLLGAVVAVGAAALAGIRVQGEAVQFPIELRAFFVPIIGVAIGGAVTPDLLTEAPGWWPSVLALLLYVPAAQVSAYLIFRRLGGQSRPTAWFAAMPGGLIEAITMGEAAGAEPRMLNLLQFLRLIACILIVPIGFTLAEGMSVGSGAGAALPASPLDAVDAAILFACGFIGLYGGRALGLPAAVITGPLLLSGAAHLAGLTQAVPPPWMIALTQLVVGITLGVRFVGLTRGEVAKGLGLTLLSLSVTLGLAVAAAFALADAVGERVEAVILAFAPGGVVEMALIAISLQIGVIYVAAHHVLRILVTVFFARHAWRRMEGA